jgi:hypothetical protein
MILLHARTLQFLAAATTTTTTTKIIIMLMLVEGAGLVRLGRKSA